MREPLLIVLVDLGREVRTKDGPVAR
jgi:hypothetical protein